MLSLFCSYMCTQTSFSEFNISFLTAASMNSDDPNLVSSFSECDNRNVKASFGRTRRDSDVGEFASGGTRCTGSHTAGPRTVFVTIDRNETCPVCLSCFPFGGVSVLVVCPDLDSEPTGFE